MTVIMMVAGKDKMENKVRDGEGPLLDDATHISGLGRSHVSFLILRCAFFFFVWIIDIGDMFYFRNKNERIRW